MNWATEAAGACIDSFSSQVSGCEAANVLAPSLTSIWLSEETLPQFLVISLKKSKAYTDDMVIRSVGWHCWHSYTTNPFKVSLSVASYGKQYKPWDTFIADRNKGTQLFSCVPISARLYPFLKLEVTQTFGGLQTYMNRIFLFEEEISHSPLRNSTASLLSQPEATYYDVKEDLVQSVSTESLVTNSEHVSFNYAADISQNDEPLTLSTDSQPLCPADKENATSPQGASITPSRSQVATREMVSSGSQNGPPLETRSQDSAHGKGSPDSGSISSVSRTSSRSSTLLRRLSELEHKYSRLSRKVEELESSASETPGTDRTASEHRCTVDISLKDDSTSRPEVKPSPSLSSERPSALTQTPSRDTGTTTPRTFEVRVPAQRNTAAQTPSKDHLPKLPMEIKDRRDTSAPHQNTPGSCDSATQTDYRYFLASDASMGQSTPQPGAVDHLKDFGDTPSTSRAEVRRSQIRGSGEDLRASSIRPDRRSAHHHSKTTAGKDAVSSRMATEKNRTPTMYETETGPAMGAGASLARKADEGLARKAVAPSLTRKKADEGLARKAGEGLARKAEAGLAIRAEVTIPDEELVRIVHSIHNKVLAKTQKTIELELMRKIGRASLL